MRLTVPGTLALLALAGPVLAQDTAPCKHEADRSSNIDVAGARLLELSAGSGSLKIVGKAGLTRVVIRAKACASDADLLADIELETRRAGSSIVVNANTGDRDWSGRRNWHENTYARLDVVVEVPAGMAAEIEDGSGEIDLAHLGDVRLNDGSGNIIANDLASVRIEDGSGNIRLVDIAGVVDIEDGSGEIDVRTARNSVRISDASGSIKVVDVAGDLTVDDDGSGSIDYDNVRGRVDIPKKRR